MGEKGDDYHTQKLTWAELKFVSATNLFEFSVKI